LSLEICIIVDQRSSVSQRITTSFGGKADVLILTEGSSPGRVRARVEDTTGV
jgi:hypothetical protein